jgi:hypothetical protein
LFVAQDDSLDVVQMLCDSGANIEAVEEKYGCTPLLSAANSNNTKAAKELIGETHSGKESEMARALSHQLSWYASTNKLALILARIYGL